jgi:hypothetical protein
MQTFLLNDSHKIMIRLGLITVFLVGLFTIFGSGDNSQVVNAASNCSTSGPTSGAYTITVCLTSPTGSTLAGNVPVTATISETGTKPMIQHMIFNLKGAYLLTDYQSPYTFTLQTARFVDGSYVIQAAPILGTGFTPTPVNVTFTFQNGVTTPPVNNNKFTPALGTNPGSGKPLVVAAVGDGASGEANEGKVTSLISSWAPNLMLYLGDVYEKGTPTEFYNWYGSTQNFAAFRAITDPTVGNHEYTSSSTAAGYFDYWNNVPNYYSFNAGGWHFISLNANAINGQVQSKPGTAQYDWLSSDLTANKAVCTLVFWHQPVYNIGSEKPQTSMQPIWTLLAQQKVEIVLNGHDHNYQRWVALDGSGNPSSSGVTEFVVGGGGHSIQAFTKTDSRVAVGFDSKTKPVPYGALRLNLSSTKATYNYINTAGTVLDSGTITCK